MAPDSLYSAMTDTAPRLPPGVLAAAVLLAVAWTTWWSWRFVLRPYLHPEEPRELPYLVPVLGHAVAFFRNSAELMTRARVRLGDSRDPFAISLAGSSMYVLTKPKDVAEAYKNMSTFSYDIFVQQMMRWCGSSEACIRDMYRDAPATAFPNPKARPLAVLARDMHIHQLFPGQNLSFLGDKFCDYFAASLRVERIAKQHPDYQRTAGGGIVVPLNTWVSDNFVRGGTDAYFGEALLQLDADLVDVFLEFDDLSWQVLYQYPRRLAGRMYAARDRLTASIERYFELPQGKRSGDAWFTKAMEDDMRALGISTHDIATMMMIIYWGVNTNTRRACFWMLSYMLQDAALLEEIRIETTGAWQSDGTLDMRHLLEACPRLDAVWNETIRLTVSAASVRYVAADTIIGGKLLRKGNRVLIPQRQLHMDESVFGADTARFDSDRFFRNDKLLRSPSWRPFGGGITICPGRFIARQSTFIFVALLLARFDVRKQHADQPFPTQDTATPVLGIMNNKPGTEFAVELRPRVAVM